MDYVDTKELKQLVVDHIDYAHALAKQFAKEVFTGNIEYEDIRATAVLGLCDAARRYNPDNGVLFKTFTYFRIRGAMFDAVRRSSHSNRFVGYHVNDNSSSNAGFTEQSEFSSSYAKNNQELEQLKEFVVDLCRSTEQIPENTDAFCVNNEYDDAEKNLIFKDTINYLYRLSTNLPGHERNIIQMHYFEGFSFPEIRQIYANVSRSWVSRLHVRGLDRLRDLVSSGANPGVDSEGR